MKFIVAIIFGVAATLGGVGVAYASFADEAGTAVSAVAAQDTSQQAVGPRAASNPVELQPGAVLWLLTGAAGLTAGVGSVVISRRRNAIPKPAEEYTPSEEAPLTAATLVGAR